MDKKKYQQLKEIIQKSNPEIMELKFGCKVEWIGPKTIFRVRDDIVNYLVKGEDNQWELGGKFHKNRIEKILGRPIRLADVLLAISSLGDEKTPLPIWAIDMAGEFFDQSSSDGSPIYLDKVWNLKDNNLDNQSDECKEFLIKLLAK